MFINRHLIAFVKGHGIRIAQTCVLQLLLTLLGSMISLGTALAVRMVQGEEKILFLDSLWHVFALITFMVVVRYILARIKAKAAERCSLGIKASLRTRLLDKLFALGPAYTGKSRTGNIASTVFSKVEYLNEYYTMYLPSAVAAIINAAIIIGVLALLNTMTALVCIIACMGLLGAPMIFYFIMRERGAEEMRALSKYYSDCLDSVQGMATLKAFNANGRQKTYIHQAGEHLRQTVMRQMSITMLENVVLQFFAGLGSAFSIAVAAWQCAGGAVQSEHLVYMLFLIGACFAPMQVLIQAWHLGYRGVTASYSIQEMENEPVRFSLEYKEKNASRGNSAGGVCFENVSFAYNEQDGDVLRDVSFTIPENTTTALVGASGSGKSTIAQLLAGFYPVREGRVIVNGETLSEHTVSGIQDLVAAVWQDCHLFYGTVEDNIRIGKPDATTEEIERAAKEASIHDFIMTLPEGYQTVIGERGMRFSGGERQRVALARAFLRNAPIVILDEATSSLDRKNEIEIQDSFRRLSRGKTALIIAHRLATIQSADQIIIMENGAIRQKGSHEELLQNSETYRALMGDQTTGGVMV